MIKDEDFFADVCVGGRIKYMKPMQNDDGYFGGTVGIEAVTIRKGFPNGHKTLIKGFLQKKDWDYLMSKGAKNYDYLALSGQMEEWTDKKGNTKAINVFETILNFQSA